MASMMGAYAVNILVAGKTDRVVAYKNGDLCDFDIDEALNMTKSIDSLEYSVANILSR